MIETHKELDAMKIIARELLKLNADEIRRVLRWANDAFAPPEKQDREKS